jgi:acyl-CoA dehydrogenase
MATAPPTAAGSENETALQVHGGCGYVEEYPVARAYREVAALAIGARISEVIGAVIAREEAL